VKILHVVPTYLPARRYGGPIFAVHGLCKALAARGHEVNVLTTNVDGPGTLDVPLDRDVEMDGVRIRYSASPYRRLYWSPQMRKALIAHVPKCDILHSHAVYLWPGVAAAKIAHEHGVPYVISPRGMLVPELIRSKSRLVKTAWLSLIEKKGFARAQAIHFTSRLEGEDAKRVGLPLPSPFVVPNGIDLPERPDVPREENMLLHLGRVNWKKGLDVVIEALPQLPGVRFVIAGNDEENLTPRLQELAQRLNVADRVEFKGPVYGAAKDELLARATLFVLMSQSENFGNAILEALAMETPAVLSPRVGLAEEVVRAKAGMTGVESIGTLLRETQTRREMGYAGRKLVETRFSWPRVAEQMEAEYCSIKSRR
jgi:glycosyltransferase involved in cell wall biosynthesis